MDSSEAFLRSEVAVAYTLLWGACLHQREEDQHKGDGKSFRASKGDSDDKEVRSNNEATGP
jgi:hypothetical protein